MARFKDSFTDEYVEHDFSKRKKEPEADGKHGTAGGLIVNCVWHDTATPSQIHALRVPVPPIEWEGSKDYTAGPILGDMDIWGKPANRTQELCVVFIDGVAYRIGTDEQVAAMLAARGDSTGQKT
jgi:hypothetical protein